jgi:GNAT superfamily N-acetyltransferase
MTSNEFTITPIDSSTSYQAWFDLFRAYLVEDNGIAKFPADQYQKTFDRLVDTGPKGDVYGFMLLSPGGNGEEMATPVPVGFALYLFHSTTWSEKGHCYLIDLYVDPGYRRRGGATGLIMQVKQEALEGKITGKGAQHMLYWHTKKENRVARELYDKLAKNEQTVYEMVLDEE